MKLNASEQGERLGWSIKSWSRMNFVTATLPQAESNPRVISEAWRNFAWDLRRHYAKGLRIVRVLQKHPGGHGWHVHAVFDRYIPASVILKYAALSGLGRMDFRMVANRDRQKVCEYLTRYITRDLRKRDKAAKGVRMVTASGSLRVARRWWVRLKDVQIEQTISILRRSLILCCEQAGMTLTKWVGIAEILSMAPVEVVDKWRKLNPAFVY